MATAGQSTASFSEGPHWGLRKQGITVTDSSDSSDSNDEKLPPNFTNLRESFSRACE